MAMTTRTLMSEMTTISMPTTLTYDKINSYLQEIKEFVIQKQPKYLSTVMQFIDLNVLLSTNLRNS